MIAVQDGRVHSSLSPKEILYFTLAYDWFAFGYVYIYTQLRTAFDYVSIIDNIVILSKRGGTKGKRLVFALRI